MLVIVPTRGRPENVIRLQQARRETEATGQTEFLYCVDHDDPRAEDYVRMDLDEGPLTSMTVAPRLRLGGTLNAAALRECGSYDVIGFMGDDHCPRTPGWDAQVMHVMSMPGPHVVYGNDLLQGAALPTAVFLDSGVVRTLGYMVPPGMIHLYLDNFWLELGQRLRGLTYLPDTVIEHIHPAAGKAEMDDGYREANAPETDAGDRARWREFKSSGLFELGVGRVLEAYRADA